MLDIVAIVAAVGDGRTVEVLTGRVKSKGFGEL
jgi:hypothetical protein